MYGFKKEDPSHKWLGSGTDHLLSLPGFALQQLDSEPTRADGSEGMRGIQYPFVIILPYVPNSFHWDSDLGGKTATIPLGPLGRRLGWRFQSPARC